MSRIGKGRWRNRRVPTLETHPFRHRSWLYSMPDRVGGGMIGIVRPLCYKSELCARQKKGYPYFLETEAASPAPKIAHSGQAVVRPPM